MQQAPRPQPWGQIYEGQDSLSGEVWLHFLRSDRFGDAAGLNSVIASVRRAIEIRHPVSFQALDEALKKILDYDWLILTSVNGVEALFNRLTALAMDESSLQHLKIAAIGPATEQAIADRGLVVDVVPDRYIV